MKNRRAYLLLAALTVMVISAFMEPGPLKMIILLAVAGGLIFEWEKFYDAISFIHGKGNDHERFFHMEMKAETLPKAGCPCIGFFIAK